jgi:hypothetical protein
MPANAAADPVLVRFRTALNEMYGNQLERVVLFGWLARAGERAGGLRLRRCNLPQGF